MRDKEMFWREEFVKNSNYRIDESLRMIKTSWKKLDEEEIWKKPNESSNSMGNLILHLCGNIRQYITSSLGGKDDIRLREAEFAESGGLSKSQLIDQLEDVIEDAKEVISKSSDKEFLSMREVQGFRLSGIGIVIHVVEHLSYHTGQIAFWTKNLKNTDLGFYDGMDLNIKNN
ncbi:MAG: DinB family protein [Flavobacteriaceae bacterium]